MIEVILPAVFFGLTGIQQDQWHQVLNKPVVVDKQEYVLARYHKKENNHLFGEHFSIVYDYKNKIIKGFVNLQVTENPTELPTTEEARAASDQFLKEFAPDLLKNREILWTKPHNEILKINQKDYVITGMKVKAINRKTGLYFWTIVNAEKKVYIFERDIRWIVFPGKRGTEKWLHDSYLAESDLAQQIQD